MIVKVKGFPVRYKGKTYRKDAEISIDKDHFNKNLMEFVDDEDEDSKPKPPSKLSKDEIKAELERLNIEYDSNAKKEELLELLLNPPEQEENQEPPTE